MAMNKLPDARDLDLLRTRMSTQFQIPSAYDDALSYQGLIYKLIQYLKDTMQNVEDWNVWLEDFVSTFDENLGGTVKETIQGWVDDGTIQVIISEALQWELDDFKEEANSRFLNKVSKGELVVNVKDFGAKGDWDGFTGTDDTQAFNDACNYAEIHTGNNSLLRAIIFVPAGQYLISGEVFVRKGQHLKGSGAGTSRIKIPNSVSKDIINMGSGLIDGEKVIDAGGLPATVSDLGFEGGMGSAILSQCDGAFIRDVFFTACNICITAKHGDLIINNIIMDMCPNGVVFTGQNMVVNNSIGFMCHYEYVFGEYANDIQITNLHSEYCLYSAVLFPEGSTVTNIQFNNAQFIANGQYETFDGFIADWSAKSDYVVNNGTFRNMPGFAVRDRNGLGHNGVFNNCIFDGEKTNPLFYDQGTTSAGILAMNSKMTLNNCIFKNLAQETVKMIGEYPINFIWNGGQIENCPSPYSIKIENTSIYSKIGLYNIKGADKTLFNAQSSIPVKTKNLTNWLELKPDSGKSAVLIPYQSGKLYRVCVSSNTAPTGSPEYRQTSVHILSVTVGYTTTMTTMLESTKLFESTANIAPAIVVDYGFDNASGDKVKYGLYPSGYIAVFVPDSYQYTAIDVQEISG